MDSTVVLYIILSGVAALVLALFQYFYKSKKSRLNLVLSFLRFLTYFFILLLIINPKFEKTTIFNEKPNLVIAIDNSESISHLDQDESALKFLDSIRQNSTLANTFDIEYYSFGKDIKSLDSVNFSDTQSDISKVFSSLDQIYKNTIAPIVLVTDGNQTFGTDYEFQTSNYKQPIYPIILGDTTTFSDLKIQQLNVNKYAYLKNRFPVEIFVSYSGNANVNSQLIITSGSSRVYSKNLDFSKTDNSQSINLTLPANRVGVNSYIARIVPLNSEKNTVNNSKPFAVEVIDQKTNVAIVSDISHPDLGALKNAIESNEQRSVSILKPGTFLRTKDNYQLAILYQPNQAFRTVMEDMNITGANKFIIAGSQTQWGFLNNIQNYYRQEITSQTEEYQPDLNNNYNTFIIDDLDFSSFPPLLSEFGDLAFNVPYETLLYKQINGNIIQEPLLLTFEENNRREGLLLGENIWKWRAQSYLNTKSFQQFDDFIGKLVQYLASNKQRRRLNLNYESFYNGNGNIIITAQFFNKNYEFDNKALLEIILKDKATDKTTILPFVIRQNNYQVDLSGLDPAEYSFTVRANNGEATQSGGLTILDYNVEQQFLNANVSKLQNIAADSQGKSYFINNSEALAFDLINDSRYATIQKSSKNIVPLIDFKYLLALIALSLAIEWFTRKYNGLI
ncbi:MAG: VWA domain-containing protein [Flavobacteriaceae bacterium]|nr:VWA domain-containing protein [Flavobacteriaceae bacterium]